MHDYLHRSVCRLRVLSRQPPFVAVPTVLLVYRDDARMDRFEPTVSRRGRGGAAHQFVRPMLGVHSAVRFSVLRVFRTVCGRNMADIWRGQRYADTVKPLNTDIL